jgi:hypothetical protein
VYKEALAAAEAESANSSHTSRTFGDNEDAMQHSHMRQSKIKKNKK